MKNQYFGDVHDFRKYGLLRVLMSTGLSLGVGWMLTPDDAGPDGQMKRYLTEPEKWRGHDPALYDFLKNIQEQGTSGGVELIEESDLLSGALFYSDFVPDNKEQRELWSIGLLDALKGSDLVFLDPDNGMMVKSKRAGLKDSSKYADWSEVKQLWQEGSSLLVYQHYPHQKREDFRKLTARNLCEATGTGRALLFSTSQVLFILLTQEHHDKAAHKALQQSLHLWEGQIKMTSYAQNDQDSSSPMQKCQLMAGSKQTADT